MGASSYNKRKEDKKVTKKSVEKMMKGVSFMAWMKNNANNRDSEMNNIKNNYSTIQWEK